MSDIYFHFRFVRFNMLISFKSYFKSICSPVLEEEEEDFRIDSEVRCDGAGAYPLCGGMSRLSRRRWLVKYPQTVTHPAHVE